MNSRRDQLLPGPRFAANQHRRVRAGHLRHLLINLTHGTAAPDDDVGDVEALAQLLLQMLVLSDELLLVLGDEALDLHRLRDHRRDDAEELHIAIEIAIRLVAQIDAEGADRPAVQ